MNHGELRNTFDENPDLYERSRPRYPEEVFDKLIDATDLPSNAKLLEIGSGTGQATEPMARRGYSITAVEMGESLANFSRAKFNEYTNVSVIGGSFEEVNLPKESFDLIYAATAFHWIDSKVKYMKSHQLLRPSGSLAVIATHHVSDEQGDEFFFASQPLYEKYQPSESNKGYRLPVSSKLTPESFDGELFDPVVFEQFPLRVSYSASEYCDLLSTFSDVLKLPVDTRKEFLDSIAQLIRSRFNDKIIKHSVVTLSVARKLNLPSSAE